MGYMRVPFFIEDSLDFPGITDDVPIFWYITISAILVPVGYRDAVDGVVHVRGHSFFRVSGSVDYVWQFSGGYVGSNRAHPANGISVRFRHGERTLHSLEYYIVCLYNDIPHHDLYTYLTFPLITIDLHDE